MWTRLEQKKGEITKSAACAHGMVQAGRMANGLASSTHHLLRSSAFAILCFHYNYLGQEMIKAKGQYQRQRPTAKPKANKNCVAFLILAYPPDLGVSNKHGDPSHGCSFELHLPPQKRASDPHKVHPRVSHHRKTARQLLHSCKELTARPGHNQIQVTHSRKLAFAH